MDVQHFFFHIKGPALHHFWAGYINTVHSKSLSCFGGGGGVEISSAALFQPQGLLDKPRVYFGICAEPSLRTFSTGAF